MVHDCLMHHHTVHEYGPCNNSHELRQLLYCIDHLTKPTGQQHPPAPAIDSVARGYEHVGEAEEEHARHAVHHGGVGLAPVVHGVVPDHAAAQADTETLPGRQLDGQGADAEQ